MPDLARYVAGPTAPAHRQTVHLPSIAVALLLVLVLVRLGPGTADTGPNAAPVGPPAADVAGIITVEQLNMCMWGSAATPACYPNDEVAGTAAWTAEESEVARKKRQSVVRQYERHRPQVITVAEGCSVDLAQVAAAIGYQMVSFHTGAGPTGVPRKCSVGRGNSVNAILASSVTPTRQGYFQAGGYRSYVCGRASISGWSSLNVCTTHLSLGQQADPDGNRRQPAECAYLRQQVLASTNGPTVLAGDLNMSRLTDECASARFDEVNNVAESEAERKADPHDGLLHIYYSRVGMYPQGCGRSSAVENTDHDGFLLGFGQQPPDTAARAAGETSAIPKRCVG